MVRRTSVFAVPPKDVRSFRRLWREFWRAPDPLLQHEGASGELTVAGIRVVVIAVLNLFPLVQLVRNPASGDARAGFAVAVVALVIAVAVYVLAQREYYRPWFGFATSTLDVTLVSAALVVFLLVGRPDMAVNSRVIYSVYFIAIAAMAFRYDPRICALVGLIGMLQYGAVVAFAELRWGLSAGGLAAGPYGEFSLDAHYGRLILLLCATMVATSAALKTQRLRWLAAKDPLTLVMNRGAFDERMQAEVARSVRHNHQLSVAMLDIDHFKGFNDTNGHLAGDEALRDLGTILESSVRKSDLVARYGGEEFIVLFPETPIDQAFRKSEELRQLIETTALTVSIGVAELPSDGTDTRSLIDCADQRLYEAKHAGRNRVVGPSPTGDAPAPRLTLESGESPDAGR